MLWMPVPEDFDAGEEAAEITTDPENYSAVVKALEEKGYEILSDDLAMVPMTTTRLTDPDQLKLMGKLLDALEDNDDVQNVWHSLARTKRICRNKLPQAGGMLIRSPFFDCEATESGLFGLRRTKKSGAVQI